MGWSSRKRSMVKEYIPEKGDIVLINFSPTKGHEQNGRRPALVLSPKAYNEKSELALFCPITSKIKGYSFEVVVTEKKVKGVILADQVKSFSWTTRKVEFMGKINPKTLLLVCDRVVQLVSE